MWGKANHTGGVYTEVMIADYAFYLFYIVQS